MAITGVHALLYSPEAGALRTLLADAFGWSHVDGGNGDGWLIFALPRTELGVHPADTPAHELSLMCDDLAATMDELRDKGVAFKDEPHSEGWGEAVTMMLPGDVEMLLYQPRHPTAI